MSDNEHDLAPGTNEPVHIPTNDAFSFLGYKNGQLHFE